MNDIHSIWCNNKIKLLMTGYMMSLSCYPWWKIVHSFSCSQKLSLGGFLFELFQFYTCVVFVGYLNHHILKEGNLISNRAWSLTTDLCLSPICCLSSDSPHPRAGAPTRPCAYSWFLYLHFYTHRLFYVWVFVGFHTFTTHWKSLNC